MVMVMSSMVVEERGKLTDDSVREYDGEWKNDKNGHGALTVRSESFEIMMKT